MPPIISNEIALYSRMEKLHESLFVAIQKKREAEAKWLAANPPPRKLRRLESYGMTEMPCGQRTAAELGLV